LPEKLVKKRVCVTLTKPYVDALVSLVREGVYASRAELIRIALRYLFRHHGIEPFGVEDVEGL